MQLALGTIAVVLIVLSWELVRPVVKRTVAEQRLAYERRRRLAATFSYDPGRERRAEQRARDLLRSCVEDEDWEMYRDLGFLRVWGPVRRAAAEPAVGAARYAYLIYPHKPIVAYVPESGEPLNEYCVEFPDETRPFGSPRLPDADDVLAKWMALLGDERGLIAQANMHLPGRQIDPDLLARDLARLSAWERERQARSAGSVRAA